MLREKTMVFVGRCPDCAGVYSGESLLFLHADEDHRYCPCGGRLVEDVASEGERHYRLIISERLVGSALHRQLEERLAEEKGIEVCPGCRDEQRTILLACCN